jgi:hypothetical protein
MTGGKMDISIKFLKISSTLRLVGLLLLLSCTQSRNEELYLREINANFSDIVFSLTDPVTGLELTAEVSSQKMDSLQAIELFKAVRKPLSKYPNINWIYLLVKQEGTPVWILREEVNHQIIFVRNREQ